MKTSMILILATGVNIGCPLPEHEDAGFVCMSTQPSGEMHVLQVDANSGNCASDHKGAEFECSVQREADGSVSVRTRFQEGRDPNDSCAPPLRAQCQLEIEPGAYEVRFGGHMATVDVPSLDTTCLPEGSFEGDA